MPLVPTDVLEIARAVRDSGGRLVIVGGWVRDALRGEPSKDLDLEFDGGSVEALRDRLLQISLTKGIEFLFNTRFEYIRRRDDGALDVKLDGHDERVFDVVMAATGRIANTEGLGLEEVGVELGERGLGDHFQRFAGRIRYEVEIESVHPSFAQPSGACGKQGA